MITLKAALMPLVGACLCQAVTFTEGFDNVSALTGAGWVITNLSNPIGTTSWFQGNAGIFGSQSGAADSYAAANLNATGLNGVISSWLITPALAVQNGTMISFYTRTDSPVSFPDRLELRFSSNGSSTNVGASETSVGDFTTLLLTVNPSLTTAGYPTTWTQFTATLSGLSGSATGRFAFRYFVIDGGALGNNSSYIGVDTLAVSDIPEPGTALTAFAAIALVAMHRRRRTH